MKEKNHQFLVDALAELPLYKAPDSAWNQIEEQLSTTQDDLLRDKIQELPVYPAPEQSWARIQGQLKVRTAPFYLRTWGIAAILILLFALAGIWNRVPQKNTSNGKPLTETKAEAEITEAQIADFQNSLAREEAELKACLENRTATTPEIESEILKLEELTQTHDSLNSFLKEGKGLPGTSPRLDNLEARRKLLIDKLRKELCGKE